MSNAQFILIGVAVVGIGVFALMRTENNSYAEREVALDSPEAQAALALLEQLTQSTNALPEVVSPKANPMVQQRLLRRAIQLKESGSVTLGSAHWTGDYLKVQVSSAPQELWFTLEKAADEGLKLLGVQD